jgi:hypothetical protein
MRYRSFSPIFGAILGASLLAGCGVARQLTTRHKTFTYTVSLPPAPANTMAHAQYTLDEQVQNTYQKYHGGVDSTRFAYHALNSSAAQAATMKLYVSTADNLTASQLDQQATLVTTITLTPSEDRTVTLEQAPSNSPLRSFLASVLRQGTVSTIHFYAATSSADPTAMITLEEFTTQVQVHGSYF